MRTINFTLLLIVLSLKAFSGSDSGGGGNGGGDKITCYGDLWNLRSLECYYNEILDEPISEVDMILIQDGSLSFQYGGTLE